VGALQKRFDAGETADVVISALAAMDGLEKAGKLAAGSRANVATVRIGVAVREGATAPDISTPEAFRQTLVDANRIAFSDAAVGGSAGRLPSADVRQAWARRRDQGQGHATAVMAARLRPSVANGEADIGMTLIAEIVPIKGARVLGFACPPRSAATRLTGAAVMAASNVRWCGAGIHRGFCGEATGALVWTDGRVDPGWLAWSSRPSAARAGYPSNPVCPWRNGSRLAPAARPGRQELIRGGAAGLIAGATLLDLARDEFAQDTRACDARAATTIEPEVARQLAEGRVVHHLDERKR